MAREGSETSVCVESRVGGYASPAGICIILMNALHFLLMMKRKYCFLKNYDLENESVFYMACLFFLIV